MSWAANYIMALQRGETVQFRPRGNSMRPLIESGQLVTVEPIYDRSKLAVGDIVLCTVHRNQYLHLIKEIWHGKFKIGNNRGNTNGWIEAAAIYGKCVQVQA